MRMSMGRGSRIRGRERGSERLGVFGLGYVHISSLWGFLWRCSLAVFEILLICDLFARITDTITTLLSGLEL